MTLEESGRGARRRSSQLDESPWVGGKLLKVPVKGGKEQKERSGRKREVSCNGTMTKKGGRNKGHDWAGTANARLRFDLEGLRRRLSLGGGHRKEAAHGTD